MAIGGPAISFENVKSIDFFEYVKQFTFEGRRPRYLHLYFLL
jgi:hypothetical protein